MNCIIVDDEPLGRKAIQLLIQDTPVLSLCGSFGDAVSAGKFMQASPVDLVFLDIKSAGGERTGVCPDDSVGYACHLCDGLCGVCPR